LAATLYPGSSSRTRTAAVSWVCTRCSHMAAHATPQRTAPTTPRLLIVREHDTHRTPCMTRTSLLPVVVAGSHWEQRLLETEVMAPLIVTYRLRISRLTLALLEDSGWYTPDYSLANVDLPGEWVLLTHCAYSESLTYSRMYSLTQPPNHPTIHPPTHPPIHPPTHTPKGSSSTSICETGRAWGYKQGCAFATEKCLDANQQSTGSPPHFCATPGAIGCAPDR
jgi:hypothetical protein